MNTTPIPGGAPTLGLTDIYYVLFRNKWKILCCAVVGIACAGLLYKSSPPLYVSEAKLLIRYILTESKQAGPTANNTTSKILPDERGGSIMTTETEILTSFDLAREVATAVGPERILAKAGGGKDIGAATAFVRSNLTVNVPQGSSVIHLSYRHPDAELAQPILAEIIDRYYKKHMDAHRGSGAIGDSLAQEADTLRSKLNQTEDELRQALNKAGVISFENAKETYSNQIYALRRDIFNLQADLAGRFAMFQEIKNRNPALAEQAAASVTEQQDTTELLEELRGLQQKVARLEAQEQELQIQFTAGSPRVQAVQEQLAAARTALKEFRDKNRTVLRAPIATPTGSTPNPDLAEASSLALQITSLQAKIKELDAQLTKVRNDASQLDQMETSILELRRRKDLEEANYRYYAATREQARINETLGSGKVSNIIAIQNPSPAFTDRVDFKRPGMLAVGGILLGLGWAFLLELYLDRSVRRPSDLQKLMQSPLLLSIPRLPTGKNGTVLPQLANGSTNDAPPDGQIVLAQPNGKKARAQVQLRAFHETLRDRLIAYFESQGLTHKPKLVAITGMGPGAGVTTTAAGLARSLSETGEGNVLLVDMTVGQGAAQQFTKGKEVCGLDELLEARSQAHVHENLYVVAESSNSERLSRSLPQRFNKLIPKLKASDFDYIIFDMPAVSQLSITPRLAGFMDMVLLVVESEKDDRGVVEDACSLLAESKAHLGFVLNKTRNYVPTRLQPELASR